TRSSFVAIALLLAAISFLFLAEASADELDEDVLERRLGLPQPENPRTLLAHGANDRPEGRIIGEHEVDGDRLPLAVVLVHGRARLDDAGQAGERGGTAVEVVELDPEDRFALDPPLQLVGRADRQDPAAIDDRDP